MNILFTLCGRAGSKGVKGKNTRDFCGKPLPLFSLNAVFLYLERYKSKDDNAIIALNTDSPELIDIITKHMPDVFVIKRDSSLAGDIVPKVAVIRDCLINAENHFGYLFDIVVDLDITSPLRKVSDIKNAIEKKLSREDTDVVFSVTSSRRNPYFNMVKQENGYYVKVMPSSFTTRQQTPVFYDMNASIYVYSVDALKKKKSELFFNENCDAIFMKDTGVLDIDSEDDYELMQVIGYYLFENDDEFKEISQIYLQTKED